MDQKLMTLRLVWGAMTAGVILAFVVLATFVPSAELSDLPFPPHYLIMGITLALAGTYYAIREKKNALIASADKTPGAEQQIMTFSILCFACAEAIGIMAGLSTVLGAAFTMSLGLLGISLILLAREFPKVS